MSSSTNASVGYQSPTTTVDTSIVSSRDSSSQHNKIDYTPKTDGVAYSNRVGDRHELTLFQDQGSSHTRLSRDNAAIPPRSGLDETYQHSIVSFLSRPQRVAVFNITTASDYLGELSLSSFFTLQSVAAKVANFRFYNCNVHYKLVVNASRYALGRVVIAHTPYNSALSADRALPASATSVQMLTSYPHAEVDFGSSESITFSVPFCDSIPWNFINEVRWSEVRLEVINPLVGTTAGETATLAVFMWVDNLQLSIPYTQGFEEEADVKSRSLIQPSCEDIHVISGAVQNHPIADELSKGVAWAGALATKAASLFGLSKPLSTLPNTPLSNIPCKGFTQCEGSSEAVSLSLRPSNGISRSTKLDLCVEDPMNINHFLTRSQIFSIINWSTALGSDTPIFNSTMMGLVTSTTSFLHGITDLYHFYRGGLVFRLSCVKNAFYSGRLAVQFYSAGSSDVVGWEANLPSIIWDIQENRELYFSIPYQSYSRMVEQKLDAGLLGRLVIYVVNPLRADPPLPQQIQVNMTVMAASDFAVAVPTNKTIIYTQGLADKDAPPPTSKEIEKFATPLLAIPPTTHDVEAILMGEPTMSLKDIVKRMTYYDLVTASAFEMDPWYFGGLDSDSPIDNVSRYYRFARGSRRYMVVLSQMPTDTNGNSPEMIFLNANLNLNSGSVITSPAVIAVPPRSANFEHRVDARLNSFIEVSVPWYSTVDRMVIGKTTVSAWEAHMTVRFWASYDENVYINPPVFNIYAAVGDDFSFSFP